MPSVSGWSHVKAKTAFSYTLNVTRRTRAALAEGAAPFRLEEPIGTLSPGKCSLT